MTTELIVGIVGSAFLLAGFGLFAWWVARVVARATRGARAVGNAVATRVRSYAYAREKRQAMRKEGLERGHLGINADIVAVLRSQHDQIQALMATITREREEREERWQREDREESEERERQREEQMITRALKRQGIGSREAS